MCGIAGVRKFGDTPITGEEIVLLLCSIEHRGQHATGIALESPEGIVVYKAAEPAWKFTKSQGFIDFLNQNLTENTRTALLHTRWYTVGSPEINENNHPMWDGETAAVHNGSISNHEHLFFSGKYQRSCQTDSDIVRAIVSAHGMNEKGVRELSKMAGSAAIAVVSTKYPDQLILARSGSPLCYGFSNDDSKMYWASESQAIMKASRPFRKIRGVWIQDVKQNVSVGGMPDDTAWVFDNEGLTYHGKFDTCAFYKQPDYSRGRESYHSKMKSARIAAETEAKRVATVYTPQSMTVQADPNLIQALIKCPACGTPNVNEAGKPWTTLTCGTCKAKLAD